MGYVFAWGVLVGAVAAWGVCALLHRKWAGEARAAFLRVCEEQRAREAMLRAALKQGREELALLQLPVMRALRERVGVEE